MSENLTTIQIVAYRDPQMQCVNEKIARLAGMKPWGDVSGCGSKKLRVQNYGAGRTCALRPEFPNPSAHKLDGPALHLYCQRPPRLA